MTFGDIIIDIIGVLIFWFLCAGWYLLGEWIENISFRRWEKKMNKKYREKED